MHQNAFVGRAPPGPAVRAYNAPPGSLAGLRGRNKVGSEGNGKEIERGRWKGKEREE